MKLASKKRSIVGSDNSFLSK